MTASGQNSELTSLVMVNGLWRDVLPVADRGLAFGDGVFETMRFSGGTVPLLPLHIERLAEGCRRLFIAVDIARIESELKAYCAKLTEALAVRECLIKLIITRGSGGAGVVPPAAQETKPSLIISARAIKSLPEIALQTCKQRLSESPVLAGLKHLNRLEYVLAGHEIKSAGTTGLLLSQSSAVVECLHHNIFWVTNQHIYTPQLKQCGVKGVMRRVIQEQLVARASLQLSEVIAGESELTGADEIFVTNAVSGITPVTRLDGAVIQPGAITSQLKSLLAQEHPGAF